MSFGTMNQLSSSLRSLLLLCSLAGLPSCGNPREDLAAETDFAGRKQSLRESSMQMEREMKILRADFEKRLGKAILRYDTLSRANDSLRAQVEEVEDDAAETRGELDAHRARYKASLRAKARGLALPRLETTDGKVFEGVMVIELTPTEAGISHSGGATRVPLASLRPEAQAKLLYDRDEVEAMKAAGIAGVDAIRGIEESVGVSVRNPTQLIDVAVVRTLTRRIVSRQAMILSAEREAAEVKNSPDAATNVAQYRIANLEGRVANFRNDIEALRTQLDVELNGPQSAGGPSDMIPRSHR
jgi:hypothetical protein